MPRMFLFCVGFLFAASRLPANTADTLFWRGIAAYHAGQRDSASVLLANALDNPYLEAFRLFYRADCLAEDSLYQETAASLDTFLALAEGGEIGPEHRLLNRARSLYIEVQAQEGGSIPTGLGSSSDAGPWEKEGLSARSLFLASRAFSEKGDRTEAIEHFLAGARARPGLEDAPLFRELFRRYEPFFEEFHSSAFLTLSSRATALRCFEEAEAALDHLLAENPTDAYALLGRAAVLSASGEPERALHQYWRIFESGAPVQAKALALLNIAAIELRLKRYEKAAGHYRMFAMYYPTRDEAPDALDVAARTRVLQREWHKALETWTVLRERHGPRMEAALGETALRSRLGRNAEAHEMLLGVARRVTGPPPAAALYWLMRTSGSDAERTTWTDSLVRTHPRSFYTAMATGDGELLSSMTAPDTAGEEMVALARGQSARVAGLDTVRADSILAGHPAFRAYRALLVHGFPEEAEITCRALLEDHDVMYRPRDAAEGRLSGPLATLEPVPEPLAALRAEAEKHGAVTFSLSLLGFAAPDDSAGVFPWRLWYPVAYVGEISIEARTAALSPLLVLAVIREESRFDPKAVSRAGAQGLMQLLPSTASWLASRADSSGGAPVDLFDPAANIRTGIRYLDYLRGRFNGSLVGTLAAYNGGEGRMARWHENFPPIGDPLAAIELIGPRETRRYVKRVLDAYVAYRILAREEAGGE